jgi:predicted  nucleic acid-binding Zn-ribbon protein
VLTDDLLELQRLDTTADQLAHRRANLPERAVAAEKEAALAEHRRAATASAARAQELELAIDALERDGEVLASQRKRLEAQLRTVTAPREAEALMHELETIAGRRDELDDQELGHLEEQSELADTIARLAATQPEVESAVAGSRTALATAEATIDGELAAIGPAREEVVARLDASLVDRYERLRARLGGVAVARLEGSRCGGCHLDISTAELAEVRAAELADCPQCGRMLVP